MFLLGITSLSIEFTRLAIEEMKQPMYLDAALELNPQFCGIMMPITLKMAFFYPSSRHTCGFSTVTGSKGVLIG